MSGKRFTDISSCIRLRMEVDTPSYRDKFFWVRELIRGFNDNMSNVFVPGWIVCVDESMVVFYNKYAPGWIVVKRKPHPMGNEYHSIACGECAIEVIEGKDKAMQRPRLQYDKLD